MEILLIFIAVIAVRCMFIFRKDFSRTHTSIVNDRLFLTLMFSAIAVSFSLSIPLWIGLKPDFTSSGYDNFLSYFKLPLGVVGLSATIAAAYGFHHTSKQKERETQILITNFKIQTATAKIEELDKICNSASLTTVNLIKMANNVYVLGERLLGKQLATSTIIRHDLNIIETYWNQFYQNDRFAPAIVQFNNQLQDIDGYLKGFVLLSMEVSTKIEGADFTRIPVHPQIQSLGEQTNLFREKIKNLENEVVEYNKKYRKNRDDWFKYRKELETSILESDSQQP